MKQGYYIVNKYDLPVDVDGDGGEFASREEAEESLRRFLEEGFYPEDESFRIGGFRREQN
jgi:2-methylisocitrate lyase-like PEP mutase family enzyme